MSLVLLLILVILRIRKYNKKRQSDRLINKDIIEQSPMQFKNPMYGFDENDPNVEDVTDQFHTYDYTEPSNVYHNPIYQSSNGNPNDETSI